MAIGYIKRIIIGIAIGLMLTCPVYAQAPDLEPPDPDIAIPEQPKIPPAQPHMHDINSESGRLGKRVSEEFDRAIARFDSTIVPDVASLNRMLDIVQDASETTKRLREDAKQDMERLDKEIDSKEQEICILQRKIAALERKGATDVTPLYADERLLKLKEALREAQQELMDLNDMRDDAEDRYQDATLWLGVYLYMYQELIMRLPDTIMDKEQDALKPKKEDPGRANMPD